MQRIGENRNAYGILVGRPGGRNFLEYLNVFREENMKTHLKEIE